jgi:hypothetical protein
MTFSTVRVGQMVPKEGEPPPARDPNLDAPLVSETPPGAPASSALTAPTPAAPPAPARPSALAAPLDPDKVLTRIAEPSRSPRASSRTPMSPSSTADAWWSIPSPWRCWC